MIIEDDYINQQLLKWLVNIPYKRKKLDILQLE